MANAVAFAKFKYYVSHVSGSSTAIGLRVIDPTGPQGSDAMTPALLVLDFIIGSILCGMVIPKATLKMGKAPYSSALMMLALIVIMPILVDGSSHFRQDSVLGAHLLALGCGLQNGLCSTWSGNVIRTTHMTGTGTDLGLAMGRIISRFLSKRGNFAPEDWEEHTADRNKVILMSLLLAGFIGGAYLGTVVWMALGEQDGDGLYTLLLPAALYCSLSVAHEFYAKSEKEAITESVALEAQFERQLSGASEAPARQKSVDSRQSYRQLGGIPEDKAAA
jgi:uncharacterized membrane protein YoaK (UPF0700 family)